MNAEDEHTNVITPFCVGERIVVCGANGERYGVIAEDVDDVCCAVDFDDGVRLEVPKSELLRA